jgi:F-type H+-transporting ATPase subunit b
LTKPGHRIALLASVSALLLFGFAATAPAAGGELVLLPDPLTMLALIAFFVLLVFPMNRLLFRPIFATLDAREERIAGTRVRAAKLAADAETTLATYETSVRAAREEAETARKAALGEARDGAQAQTQAARAAAETDIERAVGEISAALVEARVSLRSDAEALARDAASTVLGRPLS